MNEEELLEETGKECKSSVKWIYVKEHSSQLHSSRACLEMLLKRLFFSKVKPHFPLIFLTQWSSKYIL